MQAKRKVLLGIFLFVVGIVLFILFVPDEGIFQILISNDILSIALGIVFFIGFAIAGTVLVADNVKALLHYYNPYKFDCVIRIVISVCMLAFFLIMLIIGIVKKHDVLTSVSFVLGVIYILIVAYNSLKIDKYRRIEKKYKNKNANVSSFFDLVSRDHYANMIINEFKKRIDFMDEIKSDFDLKTETETVIIKAYNMRLKLVFDNDDYICKMDLPLIVYQTLDDGDIMYNGHKLSELIQILEYDDELNLNYNYNNRSKNYNALARLVKEKYSMALELVSFCKKS